MQMTRFLADMGGRCLRWSQCSAVVNQLNEWQVGRLVDEYEIRGWLVLAAGQELTSNKPQPSAAVDGGDSGLAIGLGGGFSVCLIKCPTFTV